MSIALSCVFVGLAVFLSGCVAQEIFPTPLPSSTPAPIPSVPANETVEANATPTAEPTATPEPTAEPTAEGKPQVQCTLLAVPSVEVGPFRSVLTARFYNLPDSVQNATLKCNSTDKGLSADRHRDSFFRNCDYPYALGRQTPYTASAEVSSEKVSCATSVFVNVNPAYSKTMQLEPQVDSISIVKSVSNTTTKNYTISNAGSLKLESITCTSSKSFATITFCPPSINAGESKQFTLTVNAASLNASTQTFDLTVKEKDTQEGVAITLTITA